MKQKNRTLFVLCLMIVSLFIFTGCASANSQEIDPTLASNLQTVATNYFNGLYEMDDETLEQYIEQYKKEKNEILYAGFENFLSARAEVGTLVDITGFDIDTADDGYTVTIFYMGSIRQSEFILGVNEDITAVTQISANPYYTFVEKMEKAALNTLLGMGTVFVVLIVIIFIISLFKYVSIFEEKIKAKGDKKAEFPREMSISQSVQSVNIETDDEIALVAVITAAIAASEGISPEGLVVRSIKRAKVRRR